ncbi:hypothetical protein IAE19_10325 [Acinetobacter sp. S40]|uniref:hypothetical protein n=1 Tax=Acinetobacter sp. S40 TaxID=2767434 RepID=UPI00190ABD9C|nr:hypothetical protein [Acinetobacter sp. S40]MBJ9985835.1 hypothetical protein [Acinetobacter sp. S40]
MKQQTDQTSLLLKVLLIIFSMIAGMTHASSEQAWKQHDQAVKTACVKASGLKNAKAVSDIMLFDDRVGYSALVLEGNYPQTHMKNRKGRELCLYQRQQKKAVVTAADGLLSSKK